MSEEEKPTPPKSDSRNIRRDELRPPENDSGLPERWKPRHRVGFFGGLSRVLLLLIVLVALVLPFTPYAGKVSRTLKALVEKAREPKVVVREVQKPVIQEKIVEVPAPPGPLPATYVPPKEVDVATLFNGIHIKTTIDSQEGDFASIERGNKNAYEVEFQLKVRIPKPNTTLPELARINPSLPKILPGLGEMLTDAKVSGFYHKLYERKTLLVQQNLTRLNKVLDRHNFFDCETILELTHPLTKRKALLIQSEMDVVSDGSDGDRMPTMPAEIYNSDYYQPFTSYEWAKRSKTPNPLLARNQSRLNALSAESKQKGLSKTKAAQLKSEMQELETRIKALHSRSSLIAEKDPFIVISLLFRDYPRVLPHAPSIGDYAAVIHGDQILPAICGDYGPTMKMGEASLMVAKKVSEKATPYNRPESDLKVSYLIFPGTAEKPFGPPDLEKWHAKVTEYLEQCGGLGDGFTLHKWENPFPPPTPPVTPPPSVVVTQPAPGGSPTTTDPASAAKQPKQDNAPKPSGTETSAPAVIPATKSPQ